MLYLHISRRVKKLRECNKYLFSCFTTQCWSLFVLNVCLRRKVRLFEVFLVPWCLKFRKGNVIFVWKKRLYSKVVWFEPTWGITISAKALAHLYNSKLFSRFRSLKFHSNQTIKKLSFWNGRHRNYNSGAEQLKKTLVYNQYLFCSNDLTKFSNLLCCTSYLIQSYMSGMRLISNWPLLSLKSCKRGILFSAQVRLHKLNSSRYFI